MRISTLYILIILAGIVSGCEKFLEKKSDQELVVPSTFRDLQGLFDYHSLINQREPNPSIISADDYYVPDAILQTRQEKDRRMYLWEKSALYTSYFHQWADCYNVIYKANLVLDETKKVTFDHLTDAERKTLMGQAYFHRGRSYMLAAWTWAKAYDENSADKDKGLPLRMDADFNKPSIRNSIQETYDQILRDLKNAALFLPETVIHPFRPTKAAAYGYIARTYLSMRRYDSCRKYADLCLQLKNELMDFNGDLPWLNPALSFPIAPSNKEVIFEAKSLYVSILSQGNVDSILYRSYENDDLRKTIFYKPGGLGSDAFKGDYYGNDGNFTGLATDEVFLMSAECYARAGNTELAMKNLNTLMKKRWRNGNYPYTSAASAGEALELILQERRKELFLRGLRWMDVKRLNKEGRNIVLQRKVNGQLIILPPNDPGFALPIPEDVIQQSGMEQN